MEIKCINQAAVHRICSGQVVLTLAVAVKELVENAIDGGATSVEIKLKDHGSKLVEVSDNGQGVEEKNFVGLTLKHHTSKIRQFEDLQCGVSTFGFRGEALSSLCALSNLTICTRHKSVNIATKIEYDQNGAIIQKSPCARQVGTTVSLQNLFSTLPVRHKEFQRNLKKEFHRMITLLNAYCIISTGVKISCYNQIGSSKRVLIINTNGAKTMKENIVSVLGSKQVSSLREFEMRSPCEADLEQYGAKLVTQPFMIIGFVSSSQHGSGRGSVDRQYYYINGRPCEIEKLSRVVNEVYHQYNKHQYPSVFLNIQIDAGSVDVNVTPDKRKIFLDYEPLLLATVKTSLCSIWEPESSSYTQNNTSLHAAGSRSQFETTTTLKRKLAEVFNGVREQENAKKRTSLDSYSALSACKKEETILDEDVAISSIPIALSKKAREENASSSSLLESVSPAAPTSVSLTEEARQDSTSSSTMESAIPDTSYPGFRIDTKRTISTETKVASDIGGNCQPDSDHSSANFDTKELRDMSQERHFSFSRVSQESSSQETDDITRSELNEADRLADENMSSFTNTEEVIYDMSSVRTRRCADVTFSLASIKERLTAPRLSDQAECPRFRAKISPEQSGSAEQELTNAICKEDFTKMEVLGQFNLGFIVTSLGPDLFIIDQHASDEKYNFEMLQKHTVIKRQTLIVPKSLSLSASNELLLIDNLDIFHKNGFEFHIEESAEPTQRVFMKTQPVSKNWSFDKDDVDELLYMIREMPKQMFRPSRVRAMFASRACRKSVMVGKALTTGEMYKLVQHMAELDQPWVNF